MSGAAAAAAAKKRREDREREEELETAPMTTDDGYEYKILRSAWATFRHPARLRAALDQEAEAGWDLFEKLDNNRVRLRRPIACRAQDAELHQDPYRTWSGMQPDALTAIVIVAVFVVILSIVGLVTLLK